jgi:hypothetical protein
MYGRIRCLWLDTAAWLTGLDWRSYGVAVAPDFVCVAYCLEGGSYERCAPGSPTRSVMTATADSSCL